VEELNDELVAGRGILLDRGMMTERMLHDRIMYNQSQLPWDTHETTAKLGMGKMRINSPDG